MLSVYSVRLPSRAMGGILIAVGLSLSVLGGCHFVYPTERAVVFVDNDTSRGVVVRAELSGAWSEDIAIGAHSGTSLFHYEEDPNIPPAVPADFTALEITFIDSCSKTLSRTEIEQTVRRDLEGRRAWYLHIDESLRNDASCP